ncbi:MAG: ribonuclease HII [Myxococcota bacterium]
MASKRVKQARAKAKGRHRELLEIERALWLHDLSVGGVDEVGAGPLAGPVVAACVVLNPNAVSGLVGVDDSKVLTEDSRESWAEVIRETALAVCVAEASVDEIDSLNIRRASMLAMERAVEGAAERMGSAIGQLLVDARILPNYPGRQLEIIRGDSRSLSIAAASVVAKVDRDQQMMEAAERFPGYGFEQHKGYSTAAHLEALRELGPCPLHRTSFAPVRSAASLSLW